MNLGKYIQTLLPEHDTVIIPGFGAFISEYKPARINKDTGEMSPPSSTLRFDPNIRFNDGLLASHIAAVDDISIAQANRLIDSEKEEILYRLDKGETVTLDEFGILFYTAEREIQFTYTGQDNLLMDAFGLGNTSLIEEPDTDEEEETVEDIPEETTEAEEMPIQAAGSFPEPESDEEAEPAEDVPDETSEAEEKTSQSAGPPHEPESGEETKPAEDIPEEQSEAVEMSAQSAGPFTEPEAVPYTYASLRDPGDVPGRRKRNKAWWLLLFLIPIIGAGIYLLFQQSEEKPAPVQVRVEVPAPEPQVVAPADTVNTAEAVADSVDQDAPATIDIVRPNPSTYYLIRGSFEDLEKSYKYMHELRGKGYHPFHLGQKGSFFLIGIDSFKNKTQAYGEQYNYLDKYPDSGVWIFIPDSI
jgi:nucleoid DNA-binding protein